MFKIYQERHTMLISPDGENQICIGMTDFMSIDKMQKMGTEISGACCDGWSAFHGKIAPFSSILDFQINPYYCPCGVMLTE